MRKLLFIFIAILSSCSTDMNNVESLGHEVKHVSVSIKEFELEEHNSRVSIAVVNKEVLHLWEKNDTLGIFPTKGGQVEFPIDENNVGKTYATFDGGGWALKDGYSYSAYYPFNFYNRNIKAIPFSYVGQAQDGVNSNAHFRDYLFLASGLTTVEDGSLKFVTEHKGNVVELDLTLPVPTTYVSFDVYTDDVIIPVDVVFDLNSETPIRKIVRCSNHLSLSLKNIITTSENQVVKVWMVFPAFSNPDKYLKAVVKDMDGNVYVSDIYTAGKGALATANFNINGYRTLKASPVLTDGMQGTIEGWVTEVTMSGTATQQ